MGCQQHWGVERKTPVDPDSSFYPGPMATPHISLPRRLQHNLGTMLRSRVAGPQAFERSLEIWGKEGPRWFSPQDPVWWVHDDAAMFIGGITALLTQMLHPGAMAGVGDFSGYKQDPWGRLQRTADYISVTTFGTIEMAEAVISRVKKIHDRVQGTDELGNPYSGSDTDLLLFVHNAEIDSFFRAYQAYGPRPLTRKQADTYVAQTAIPARLLGVEDPPTTVSQLHGQLRDFRSQLTMTTSAQEAARFVLHQPPISGAGRVGYSMLCAGAVALLPGFARDMLGLKVGPRMSAYGLKPLGKMVANTVRWGLAGLNKSELLPGELQQLYRQTYGL